MVATIEKPTQQYNKSDFKYVPMIQQRPLDMKFHYYKEDGTLDIIDNYTLIKSIDELKEFAEKCVGKIIAVDTETTGLTYYEDKIVGFSISLDAYSGVYVPIRHQIRREEKIKEAKRDENGNILYTKAGKPRQQTVSKYEYFDQPQNLPDREALDILWDIMLNAKVSLLHNSEFDLNMLKAEGYDITKIKTFDTLILPYIYDAEGRKVAGLKEVSKLLGRRAPTFKETVGDEGNFQYTIPSESYKYASCHDKETEVLTENGWVLWSEYNGIDKLATVNIETDVFEYQAPVNVTKYRYNGDMYQYKSKTIDFCLTPNHKLLVYPSQDPSKTAIRKEVQNLNQYEKIYMQPKGKLGGEKFELQTTRGGRLTSNQLAKLTALVLADGWTNNKTSKRRGNRVSVSLSIEKHFEEITSFLDTLPLNATYTKSTSSEKVRNWNCWDKALWELLHDCCKGKARGKYVPDFIKNMPVEDIQDFIHFYNITDGYTIENTHYLYTVSPKMRDDLMELLLMIGQTSVCHIREPQRDNFFNGRLVKAENCVTQYHIHYTSNRKSIGVKQYTNNMSKIPYNDYVYCAEVPNHTLITRRNGKILISGNCDVANTYYIYLQLYPRVKKLLAKYDKTISLENNKPYDIIARDNELIRAFVDYYGHVDIEVDTPVAEAYKKKIEEDLQEYSQKVYSYFNKGIFSLSTGSKEFKSIMEEFHVVTGAYTDKGAIAFSKKGIEEFARNMRDLKFIIENFDRISYDIGGHIDKRADIVNYRLASIIEIYSQPYFVVRPDKSINSVHVTSKTGSYIEKEAFKELLQTMLEKETEKLEILKAIQKIASLNKALNSYIDKLTQVNHCKMKYKLQGTTSGRLASGNGSKNDKKKNHYYIDLNAQNLTKPNPAFYLAEECSEDDPDNILGYKFTLVTDEYYHEHKDDEDKIIVEGAQPTANIRKCMKAGYQDIYYYKEIDDTNGTEEDEFYQIKVKDTVLTVTDSTIVKVNDKEIPVSQAKHKKSLGKHKYKLVEWKDNREVTHFDKHKKVPRYCLSLDYSSQEYIVLADISRDSLMLDNFYKGIDPHMATAYAIWGEENYDKFKRRKAKVCNFCIGYGGTAPTLAQQLDIPLEEAKQIIEGYEKGFWECMQWKKNEINKMYRQGGVCFTVFGRPRQFASRLKMADGFDDPKVSERLVKAVERRVPNHIIQGTCGDILRWVLIKLYRRYFKERDPHIDFLNTVHDEVNYGVDRRFAVKYARELQDLMKFDKLNPKLPIETSIDVGTSYGQVFPFKWADKERTRLVPKRA